MTIVLIELPFFPSIQVMQLVKKSTNICFEAHESFQRQTHRNRTYVLSASGVQCLTIPISKADKKRRIKDVRIDGNNKWRSLHLKSISTCYSSAPFYEHYIDDIISIYRSRYEFLWDFNMKIWYFVINSLGLPADTTISQCYKESSVIDSIDYIDYRNIFSRRDNNLSGDGISFRPYSQVFGTSFSVNLSVLDLLLNVGPEGINFL